LLSPQERSGILARSDFARHTLRGAWHLTSIAWWGSAAILAALALAPLDPMGSVVLEILGAVYAASAIVILVGCRGRHLAWPLLLLIAMAAWGAALASHGEAVAAAAIRVIGMSTCAALVAIAALHAYWAAGGSRGSRAAIPEIDGRALFVPRPLATASVAVALVLAAVVLAWHLRIIAPPVPETATLVGCWFVGDDLHPAGDRRFPAGWLLQAGPRIALCAVGHRRLFAAMPGARSRHHRDMRVA
jgi:hypothetical protein